MTLPLLHAESYIVRQLVTPSLPGWTVYAGSEPTEPDNAVMIFDTEGQADGRSSVDGAILEHQGLQFLLRSTDHPTGIAQAKALRRLLAESFYANKLTVDAAVYIVWGFYKIKPVLFVGRDVGRSQRYLFSVNCLTSVERVS